MAILRKGNEWLRNGTVLSVVEKKEIGGAINENLLLPIGSQIVIPKFGMDSNVTMTLTEVVPLTERDIADGLGTRSYHFKGSKGRSQYYPETMLKKKMDEGSLIRKNLRMEPGGTISISGPEKLKLLGINDSREFGNKYRAWINQMVKLNDLGTYVGYKLRVNGNENNIEIIGMKGTLDVEIRDYSKFPEHPDGAFAYRASMVHYEEGGVLGNYYYLIVNLDERGEYSASVYNSDDEEVWSCDTEVVNEMVEDGFLKYKPYEDLEGLTEYLIDMGILDDQDSKIVSESEFEKNKEKYKKGGRLKSALMRDRKYTSEQEHEQAYKPHRVSKELHYKERGAAIPTGREDLIWDKKHPKGAKELEAAYKKLLNEDLSSGEFNDKWEKIATAIVNKYEQGGKIPNNYEGETAEQVWEKWDKGERTHFLQGHFKSLEFDWSKLEKLSGQNYSVLPDYVTERLEGHVQQGEYGGGGKVKGKNKTYISADEYRERLENMSSEDLLQEVEEQIGIEVSLQEIEDDPDTFIDDLVGRYEQTMSSRGERGFGNGGEIQSLTPPGVH